MPIENCFNSEEGKPGYKVQNTSGCPHTYIPGNKASRERAKKKAEDQLVAIKIHQNDNKEQL